ncbi:chromatin structure-remodeling complex subunit RSC7 [Malassezia caprae]|uniref:Chromatin structure-remodeling complex subunit RSC7 n=1 Tax=Malassezia caprae TaxID=1381934 RepID=A0AAF0E946_9BASI|nr:chromatin structure-remodeling complex subunit RSC7 [Malassezia caprae]
MARPRRSTRARRARSPSTSELSSEDSDTYRVSERPRRRARTSRTPRDDTPRDDASEDANVADDVVEIDGQEYRVEDDSLVLGTDDAGEKKIDAQGRLLGGRSYRIATLTSPERSDPERLYMLSIDVARVLGYRDSAYFFRKNPIFYKVFLTQDEKDTLVADGRLNSSLRTRNVSMVTARAVFMQMGARVVARGRMVTDDYYEAQARADGKKEGAPVAMPSLDDILRAERRRESDRERERGRRRPDASTYTTIDAQGETVVTTFGDAGHAPFERAESSAQRRALLQRADLSEDNWMAEYARSSPFPARPSA